MPKFYQRLLGAVFLIGAFSRLFLLDSAAPGIHPDEAMNGNEGLYAVTNASPQLFYPANFGREGFFVNLVGTSVWLFGNNRFGLRFWSAIIGLAAIPLIYGLGRELFSRSVGLWSAFLLATSFWHLNFSRIAFRAILVPTLLLAAFYGLLRAWRSGRWQWAVAGGLAFGLGFHSYIAFRIAPLLVIPLLGMRHYSRARLKLSGFWLAAAFVVALPMGLHFLEHPEDFTGRTAQLSVFSQDNPAKTISVALIKSALMFNWKGDCNEWHNLSCDPELPLPLSAVFVLGLGIALWGFRSKCRNQFRFLLVWVVIMMLPAVFAWEGTPHALRSIGAIPPVFLLTALGVDFVFTRLRSHRFLQAAFVTVIAVTCFAEYYRYFAVWANSPGALQRSRYQMVGIAAYLNALDAKTPRFVVVNDYGALDPADPAHPEKKVYTAAQPVIFLTQGHSKPVYLLVEDMFETQFPRGSVIVPLAIDPRIFQALRERGVALVEEDHENFIAAKVQ